jgi:hypothetical protein
MKLYIKLMIFLVILACVAPFVLKRHDGRPWMSVSDLKTPDITLPDVKPIADHIANMTNKESDKRSPELATVYKWKDKNGVWHFADKANPTSPGEAIEIDPHANLVHIEQRRSDTVQASENGDIAMNDSEKTDDQSGSLDSDGNPYQHLPGLIEGAKNIEQVVNRRSASQQHAIEQATN